jgi:hypothetical protein
MWSAADANTNAAHVRARLEGDIMWPRHFAALMHFYSARGHCNIPTREKYSCVLEGLGPDGGALEYSGNLGSWVDYQRRCKKGTAGGCRLTPDREAMLQALVDEGELNPF